MGTGFVNFWDILRANQGQGQAMAGKVAGDVTGQAQGALGALQRLQEGARRSSAGSLQEANPEAYQQAATGLEAAGARARAASDPSGAGVSALLGEKYGKGGGYSSGERGFDTWLTMAQGGKTLAGLRGYGDLSSQLGQAASAYRPSAPGAPMFGGAPQFSPPGMVKQERPAAPQEERLPDWSTPGGAWNWWSQRRTHGR